MSVNPQLLVTRGLFPENMPPVYTTSKLWSAMSPTTKTYSVSANCVGDYAVYNASKRGGQRRLFGIPHPIFLKDQGTFFNHYWTKLETIFDAAIGSVSRPILDETGPRYVRITSHRELPKIRLQRLSRFKYCLITDVSRFYPSIYTHSLPWAINGKASAKKDTSPSSLTVFGNRLDFLLRQAQSRQTVGIPVGPDASKIASEIIMSAVDARFIQISGKTPTYVRHVDDYWIGANTYDECDKHLQNLRLALKDYQLDINEAKTRTVSTKIVFGESWPLDFDGQILDSLASGSKLSRFEPVSTFAKIVERATRDNDDGIIKHAIRVIDEKRLWSTNWDILEHFLAHCAVQFPHSFDYVARVIAWRLRTNKMIDKQLWVDVAQLTGSQNSKLGRDSETAWAIWLLKELNQRITKELSSMMLDNNGSMVLGFLAHFRKHGLADDRKLYNSMRDVISGDPFAGTSWPLALELEHLGQGDPNWTQGAPPSALRTLHNAKASIIDWDALPKVFSETTGDHGPDAPDYAIEDYGSDYGSTDEDQNNLIEDADPF